MTDGSPQISVLMSVFDTPAEYLDASIESILGQSFGNFEFVIVDDGSSDATRARLHAHASRDRRIRLLCLEANVGLTRALNQGLGLVRGKYLARQDADDLSFPTRLEESFRFLEDNPRFAAVGTGFRLTDSRGAALRDISIDAARGKILRRNIFAHGSMMFRTAVFQEIGGYDERMRLSQDYELYLRMIRLHGMQIGILPRTLYSLRQHRNSLSSRKTLRQLYFSVLAKTLTMPGDVQPWRRKIYFAKEFVRDLVVTHRFLLGPVVRRYLFK